MGELGSALLQTLGGGVPGTPTSPVGTVPPENGMTAAVMGFPSVNRGGISETGALPQVTGGGQDAAVDAVVKGFKPKKISFWGALGDQLLKHWGNQPQFEKRVQNINMNRAMEGFTGDPMEAVRRIAQIPGMEGKAWDLMNQIQDNERMREVAQAGVNDKRERLIGRANQIFGGVAPDGSNWPAIRQLYMTTLERNNIKDVYVPEEWDPAFMQAQIAGGMTFNQQDQARFREQEQARKNANTASMIGHRSAQEEQAAINEQGRNDRFATGEAGKDRRSASSGAAGPNTKGRAFKDSSGRLVEFDKSGAGIKVTSPDGKKLDFFKMGVDGKPVHIKSMTKEEYEAAQKRK